MSTDGTAGTTRARVIEAARACFTEHGVAETSLETVANAAGVHRVTLHRAFPGGRAELIVEVLREAADGLAREVRARVAKAPTATAAAASAATYVVMQARNDPIVSEALASPEAQHALASAAGAPLQALIGEMWGLIATKAQETGEWARPDLDPAQLADHLARVLLSLATNPVGVATPAQVRRYLETFVLPAVIRAEP